MMLGKLLTPLITLSDNQALPERAAWKVKSFWLQVLMVATVLLTYLGVDLMAVLAGMGLGGDPAAVIATGERAVSAVQQLIPIALGIWTWFERRAPKYRLILWPKVKLPGFDLVGLILLSVLLIGASAGGAMAQPQCGPVKDVQAALVEKWHEQLAGSGTARGETAVTLTVNPDTGSWTIFGIMNNTACLIASGQDWTVHEVKAGEPM
jgi:hypothetical protein